MTTRSVRAQGEPTTLRPNRRPELVIGGTCVPREEFACCRVRCDGDLMTAQLSRAALRPVSGPAARVDHQLVYLHGMGNQPPPSVVAEVFTCRNCTTWCGLCLGRRRRLLVRMSNLSCGVETCHLRRRLVVRGADLSCEAETCRARRRLVGGGSSCGELVGEAPN
jgi:hypothetical protein